MGNVMCANDWIKTVVLKDTSKGGLSIKVTIYVCCKLIEMRVHEIMVFFYRILRHIISETRQFIFHLPPCINGI